MNTLTCATCSEAFTAVRCDARFCSTRCRKDSHRRPCPDCGTLMSGSDGNGPNAPQFCVSCAAKRSGVERKVWTRAALIEAIRAWASEHDEPPAVCDWNPTHARYTLHDEERARRFELAAGRWPHAHSVRREFGSWADGIRAAGFVPRVPLGTAENHRRSRRARQAVAA